MKVCLILCFLNALTSSKKKFAQTYGKNYYLHRNHRFLCIFDPIYRILHERYTDIILLC